MISARLTDHGGRFSHRYEVLSAEHEAAANDFAALAFDIDAIFTKLRLVAGRGRSLTLLLDFEEEADEEADEEAERAEDLEGEGGQGGPGDGSTPAPPSAPPSPPSQPASPSALPAGLGSPRGPAGSPRGPHGIRRDVCLAFDSSLVTFRTEELPATPLARTRPSIKIQAWYRRAGEYRAAHAIMTAGLVRASARISLLLLVLSTAVSIILMLDEDAIGFTWNNSLVAAVASAVSTALSGAARYRDYPRRIEEHGASVRDFANLERELLTLIHAATQRQKAFRLDAVAERYNQAIGRMPLLPRVRGYKDEKKRPLFSFITTAAQTEEVAQQHAAMLELAGM